MNKIYGYCRISTKKQSIERQIRNIKKAYPDAIIIEEEYTGTTIDRKKWNKLYSHVTTGDTIIFDSVSRMSRNAAEGFEAYDELYRKGISLVFLKEPHINTDTFKKALSDADLKRTGTNVDFILEGVSKYLMALAKEQIRQIISENNINSVADIYTLLKDSFKDILQELMEAEGTKLTTKKSIEAKKVIFEHSRDFNGTLKDLDVMKLTGLARNTYYKYKAEMKQNKQ